VTWIAFALAASVQPIEPPLMSSAPVTVSAPRWAGQPDLCVITLTTADADGARIVRHLYRILGDGGGAADPGPAFAAAQERRCASTPPLDLDDPAGERGLIMLNGEDPDEGAVGISMIRQAQREARDGTHGDIACDADAAPENRTPECADPRRVLAGLDLAGVPMVDVSRRDDGRVYSVDAMFDLTPGPGWHLRLEAEVSGTRTQAGPFRFLRTRLSKLMTFDVVDEPPPIE
jgi:hypothetical protein